jgi:hypothetical protein
VFSVVEPAPPPSTKAWTKPISQALRSDLPPSSQNQTSTNQTPPPEPKESLPSSMNSNSSAPSLPQVHADPSLEAVCPKNTMIFENTNLKGAGKFSDGFGKMGPKGSDDSSESLPTSIEKNLDLPLPYGKGPCGNAVNLDFGSSFEDDSVPPPSQAAPGSNKPMGSMSQQQAPRPYAHTHMSHQPSPISPLAADLSENIQSVRSLWDTPSTVSDGVNACVSEDSSLSSGFGGDSFKRTENSREPIGDKTIGYTPINSTPISVIAKPGSSSSPTSAGIRQMKPVQQQQQQQSVMESQSHLPMQFSPFCYGGASFGGLPAPSPPAAMYGKPHAAPGPNPVYQTFQHPESSHVSGRA